MFEGYEERSVHQHLVPMTKQCCDTKSECSPTQQSIVKGSFAGVESMHETAANMTIVPVWC